MTTPSSQEVTRLLLAWNQGEPGALDQLIPLVYDELRRVAKRQMARERAGHILQTTALVNEVYLRLVDTRKVAWQDRAHFFAIAANLMRQVLVEFARNQRRLKRGAGARQVSLSQALDIPDKQNIDLIALDDALTALATINERQAKVVELRFFGGLTEEEAAEVLQVSPRTIRNDWSLAKVRLLRELSKGARDDV